MLSINLVQNNFWPTPTPSLPTYAPQSPQAQPFSPFGLGQLLGTLLGALSSLQRGWGNFVQRIPGQEGFSPIPRDLPADPRHPAPRGWHWEKAPDGARRIGNSSRGVPPQEYVLANEGYRAFIAMPSQQGGWVVKLDPREFPRIPDVLSNPTLPDGAGQAAVVMPLPKEYVYNKDGSISPATMPQYQMQKTVDGWIPVHRPGVYLNA